MKPVHIETKRSFWLLRGVGSVVLAAVSIVLLLRAVPGTLVWWVSVVAAIFFVMGAIVGIAQGMRRGPRITLDATGVHDRTLGVGVIPWSDIARVEPYGVAQQGFVGLHLHDAAPYLARASMLKRMLARLNRGSGFPPFSVNLAGVDAEPGWVASMIIGMHEDNQRPPDDGVAARRTDR